MRKLLAVGLILISVTAGAQEAPPTLTEVERLKVQLATKEMENAFLRMQAAQEVFFKARIALQATITPLQKPGWVLDPEKGEYTPELPKETK